MDFMEMLEGIMGLMKGGLDKKDGVREKALRSCRQLVNNSAKAIRSIHKGDFGLAALLLTEANAVNKQLRNLQEVALDLYYSGYVHDAQKEFAEAAIFSTVLSGLETFPFLGGSFERP